MKVTCSTSPTGLFRTTADCSHHPPGRTVRFRGGASARRLARRQNAGYDQRIHWRNASVGHAESVGHAGPGSSAGVPADQRLTDASEGATPRFKLLTPSKLDGCSLPVRRAFPAVSPDHLNVDRSGFLSELPEPLGLGLPQLVHADAQFVDPAFVLQVRGDRVKDAEGPDDCDQGHDPTEGLAEEVHTLKAIGRRTRWLDAL